MKTRCPWLKLTNPKYVKYHDYEWGRPIRSDRKHFEYLTLEGAQAGLSWETILNKRENYRIAFDQFQFEKIAKYNNRKVESLLKNPGIVRNRLKVESTITNAKAFIRVRKEFGSFNKFIWRYVDNSPIQNNYKLLKDYPSKTELSDTISKDLKARGFKFVGSTIVYSYLQAAGLVNDHSRKCFLHPANN
tara:strand:- start:397 stop:963 length:567 start_codon:yes stop_codon:yes gene_type:complete